MAREPMSSAMTRPHYQQDDNILPEIQSQESPTITTLNRFSRLYESMASWLRSFLSLRWQISFAHTLLFILFIVILSVFIYSTTSNLLYGNAQSAFQQRVPVLSAQAADELYCGHLAPQDTVALLGQDNTANDIDAIFIVGVNGKVVASSNHSLLNARFPYLGRLQGIAPTQDGTPKAQPFLLPTVNADANGLLVPLVPPKHCTSAATTFQGYLAATTSYRIERTTLGYLRMIILVAAGIIVTISIVCMFFLTRFLLRPLRRMSETAQAIALGDFSQRVQLPWGNDELGELASSFNDMVAQIEQSIAVHQASERRARRFISDASHELRTPLTSLRGFTEVLLRGAKDDKETLQRVLKSMKHETERMTRLVNDLLTLARLDEGHPLQTERLDLLAIAIEAVEQARILAGEGYRVALSLVTEEQLTIQGDGGRLSQVLHILFDNAIKYGRPAPSGEIILRLEKQDGHALMHVIDNGKGIPPDDLPHIFDHFYRGRALSSSGKPIEGVGLGLSIARAIVLAHQGEITAASEPGRTVFTVSLPSAA